MSGISCVLPIEYDSDGEVILTFTEEILEELNWQVGDVLNWTDNGDGSWTLTKYEDSAPQ